MKTNNFVYIIVGIIYTFFVLILGLVSYRFGEMNKVCGHDIHRYEVLQYKLDREKEFSIALENGLQWYMKNDSVLWNSAFVKTREYDRIQCRVYNNCEETDTVDEKS